MNNADGTPRGGRECPKCMFSMEYLRDSPVLNREEGYVMDGGVGFDPDDNPITSGLFGSPYRFVLRNIIEPFFSKVRGDRRNRKYQEILRLFPNSLICTHCEFVIKQR